MSIQVGFVPRGRNALTIRVTSYDDHCLKGILSGAQLEGDKPFTGVIDLLLQIEDLMDRTNTPQRNEEPRRFPTVSPLSSASEAYRQAGGEKAKAIAVFQLNGMCRQNATWQGSLFWVDEGQEAHFRSVLELLHLLNSVLTAVKDGEG